MHTAQQAKALWCPMVREHVNVETRVNAEMTAIAANRDAFAKPMGSCIADQCAMWRWFDPRPRDARTTESVNAQSNRKGYCGLAGKAEIMP